MKKTDKNNSAKTDSNKELLRQLPGVDTILDLLQKNDDCSGIPHSVLVAAARDAVNQHRQAILESKEGAGQTVNDQQIALDAANLAKKDMTPNLDVLINATGIVIHTNLGRSLLCKEAVEHMHRVAAGYSNLEFDISKGERGTRYSCVEDLICELTGAPAAMVVNNNAGAVLLAIDSIAAQKEVIVSRGELIEIGGSFRIPDVMKKSNGILVETGTTNRTHIKDYESSITENTGLLLKVHTSNYHIVGFTAEVSLEKLVELGKKHGLPVMDDLGSGTLIDFARYGLGAEPTVAETVASGADVITFSGDKLLGGPQAGIIVGKKSVVDAIRKNPLTRALRIDKLTLAALEMTLRAYRDPEKAVKTIPTLKMMTSPLDEVKQRAETLAEELNKIGKSVLDINILSLPSRPGGGSMPFLEIPSSCVGVTIKDMSVNRLEKTLRKNRPAVIGRIENDRFIMDMRTVADSDISVIKDAFAGIIAAL